MNETIHSGRATDLPWSTGQHGARVPDTSMLPGSEKAPPATVGLLNDTVRGAHETLDRLADSAAPAVRQLGEGLAEAGEALQAKADLLREKRDRWAEGARGTVRSHPLAAVAAAVAVGALIGRLSR